MNIAGLPGRDGLRRMIPDWQSVIVVSLVTLMLWLFAEASSLTSAPGSTVLRVVDPRGGRVVEVLGESWAERRPISVTLQGPATSVQDVVRRLDEGVLLHVGSAGVPDAEGEQTIDLRAALREYKPFTSSGVTVTSVDPPTARIRVQSIDTLENVEIVPDLAGVRVDGPVLIEPSRVTIKAPRAVIEALRGLMRGPRVVARPSTAAIEGLTGAGRQSLDVRLLLPAQYAGASNVEIIPPTASLTLTINSRRESLQIPSAPVWVALPPTEGDRWRVEINPEDRLVRDISVSGPTDLIASIREGKTPVIAVVTLTSDELQQRVATKAISFWQPAGLQVDGVEFPIRFTIEPRTAETQPGQEQPLLPFLPAGPR